LPLLEWMCPSSYLFDIWKPFKFSANGSTYSLHMVVHRILILIALILMHAVLALLPYLNSQWVWVGTAL
jgi:hypothetical protein